MNGDRKVSVNLGLERFIRAQEDIYQSALQEITAGRKIGHWMWYIFPQLAGLGRSSTSEYYGIRGLPEAKEYIVNDVLGARLIEISNAVLQLPTSNAYEVFGSPDNMKLKSSMTLFAMADADRYVFYEVLEKYFGGDLDKRTLNLLGL